MADKAQKSSQSPRKKRTADTKDTNGNRSTGHWETTDTGTNFPRIWVEDKPKKRTR
jgi:hypothetical protein